MLVVIASRTNDLASGNTIMTTTIDTFRSNQIREGVLSREAALRFVTEENKPRYQNIKWYLDAVNMDFLDVIGIVNAMPRPETRVSR